MTPTFDVAFYAALLITALHWFPWGRLPGRMGKDLPRLIAYAIGVLVILGVPTWHYFRLAPLAGETVLRMFWTAGFAAGAATVGAWIVDALIEGVHLSADAEEAAHERREKRLD